MYLLGEGRSNQALLAAAGIVPLGAALELYKEGTCPVSSILSAESFNSASGSGSLWLQ